VSTNSPNSRKRCGWWLFSLAFLCCSSAVGVSAPSQDTGQGDPGLSEDRPILSDPIVRYRIEVRLDPLEKIVKGHEVLTWVNRSDQDLEDFCFHLYLNAFKNNRSTFSLKNEGWRSRQNRVHPPGSNGRWWFHRDDPVAQLFAPSHRQQNLWGPTGKRHTLQSQRNIRLTDGTGGSSTDHLGIHRFWETIGRRKSSLRSIPCA